MKAISGIRKSLPRTDKSDAVEKRYRDLGFRFKEQEETSVRKKAFKAPFEFPSLFEDVDFTITTIQR